MGLFGGRKRLKEELEQQQQLQYAQEKEFRAQQMEHEQREREWLAERARRDREDFQRREQKRHQREQQQLAEERENMAVEQRRLQQEEIENLRQQRLRQTTPVALRRLRELIRTRYQLDVYIWSLRFARAADHEVVIEHGRKADAVLQEIYNIVNTWQEQNWTPEEWKLAKKVRDQIYAGGQRHWEGNPPWNDI